MRDILVTLLVMGLLPFCLTRPWVGILGWYWLSIMNPHRLAFGFAATAPFAQAIAIATLVGFLFHLRERRPINWTAEMVLMALFLGYVTFTTFFAWAPDAAWIQWDKVSKVIAMTFFASLLIYGKDRIRLLMLVVIISVGVHAAKGGLFALATGGAYRVQGPSHTFLSGNNFFGLALVMTIPLMIFAARVETSRWLRHALRATAGLAIIAAIFTYSRGALIGLVPVVVFCVLRGRNRFLVLIALIPILYFGKDMLPEKLTRRAETIESYSEDMSAMQRLQAWSVSFNIAKDRPFFGAGFNFEESPNEARWLGYADRRFDEWGKRSRATHSIYFQVLGQHGFVGFGLWLGMLALAIRHLAKIKREAESSPETHWIASYATGLQIGFAGYLLTGSFVSSGYFDMAYLYVAITSLLDRELRAAVAGRPAVPATPAWRERGTRAGRRVSAPPQGAALKASRPSYRHGASQ